MGEGVSTIKGGTRQRGSDNLSSQKPNVMKLSDGTKAEWKKSVTGAELETDKLTIYVDKQYTGKYQGKYRAEGFLKPKDGEEPDMEYRDGMRVALPNYYGRYTDTIDEAIKGANDWLKFQHSKK